MKTKASIVRKYNIPHTVDATLVFGHYRKYDSARGYIEAIYGNIYSAMYRMVRDIECGE